jgi:hypothetical protein
MAWERLQEEIADLFTPEFTVQDEVVAYAGRVLGKSRMPRPKLSQYTVRGQKFVTARRCNNGYEVRSLA